MKDTPAPAPQVHHEQLAYAGVLDRLSHLAILVIGGSYAAYVLNLLPQGVSIVETASSWHLRASEMQSTLHAPLGWSFMADPSSLGLGDTLSYLSIILVCMIPVICLLFTAPAFLREKRPVFVVLSLLQVLILLVAATGILVR